MALKTIGTTAQTTLTGFVVGTNDLISADVATLLTSIKGDAPSGINGVVSLGSIWPSAYSQQGLLYVPNRGVLKCFAGDFVAFDSQTGWPILVSATAAAAAGYVHT